VGHVRRKKGLRRGKSKVKRGTKTRSKPVKRKLPRKPRKPREAPRKPRRPPREAPLKPPRRKPKRKPPGRPPRKPRKLPWKPRKPREAPRKPRRPPREPPREPPKRKPKRKLPVPPTPLPPRALAAEANIQGYLVSIINVISSINPELEVGMKSFINVDGTVDGEVRISNIPDEWRVQDGLPMLAEFLSSVFKVAGVMSAGPEGGGYYISIGCRFGPKSESELAELAEFYKRFRGLFQIACYYTSAEDLSSILNQVVGIRLMIQSLMDKRGLPPAVIFVRVTWTPDDMKPKRYEGEKGSG